MIKILEEYIEEGTNSQIHHILQECIAINQSALHHFLIESIAPRTTQEGHTIELPFFFA